MNILPTNCPSCNYKLEWSSTQVDLFCHNPLCSAKNGRKLLHFFQSLSNLDGFGPKTIERLMENGFDTIHKIYNMKYIDFQDCGYKSKTIINLGSELELSKERPISPATFISALGIENLGHGNSKKLLEKYNVYDILFNIVTSDITSINGFGNITSTSICLELDERVKEITDIYKIDFNIKEEEKVEVKESFITGKRICFTGKSIVPRKEMQKQAEGLGAISVGSVNSKTDILVCGGKVGVNKINAAKKFGTVIYTEEEYFNQLK